MSPQTFFYIALAESVQKQSLILLALDARLIRNYWQEIKIKRKKKMKTACKLIYIKYEIKNAQSYDRPTVKKKKK